MRTPPMIKMPRPLDITRARCADVAYREYPSVNWISALPGFLEGYPEGATVMDFPSLTWVNYLSSYLWDLGNILNNTFSRIYIDLKYGNVIFKNADAVYPISGETVTYIPDWGPFISAGVSFGELAFSLSGFRINIKGTTHDSIEVFTRVDVHDDVGVGEAGDVVRIFPLFYRQDVDSQIRRFGPDVSYSTYEELESAYNNSPDFVIANSSGTAAGTGVTAVYHFGVLDNVMGDSFATYISFDTSSLSGIPLTTATLKLHISAIGSNYGTHQVNIYSHSFDILDLGDWGGGGGALLDTILASSLSVGLNSIDIPVAYVDKDNRTQIHIHNTYEISNGLMPLPPCSDAGAPTTSDNRSQSVVMDLSQTYLEVEE